MPNIILACDYRGVALRDEIAAYAKENSWNFKDIGIPKGSFLDYVDISRQLAEEMKEPDTVGVIICGSGEGVAMATNRYSHVRAAACRKPEDAISVRTKLNGNVICLGSRHVNLDQALEIIRTFLNTPFGAEKHGPYAAKLDLRPTEHTYNGVNLIVRAVIEHEGYILLCRATQENREFSSRFLFLPGGHVEHNEPTYAALLREIREEMSLEVESASFLGALECSWDRKGQVYHEINIVYRTQLPGLRLEAPPVSTEKLQEFVWAPLSSLANLKILPTHLSPLIADHLSEKIPAKSRFYSQMLQC